MATVIYRDTAVTTGHGAAFEVLTRLLANGWTLVAKGSGTGGTRTTSAVASAAHFNAVGAWALLVHTVSSRKLALWRRADSNTWTFQYTEGGQVLAADGTTPEEIPDSNATYTQPVFDNAQWYPTSAPTDCLMHTVVDTVTSAFVTLIRRTPFIADTSACSYLFCDPVTALTWVANPDPCVTGAYFSNTNAALAQLTGGGGKGWYARGLGGQAWSTWVLENPLSLVGTTTADPSGTDVEMEVRWGLGGIAVLGKSTLFKALQPIRSPIVGLDSGGTLNRAAFLQVSVANDGTALGS